MEAHFSPKAEAEADDKGKLTISEGERKEINPMKEDEIESPTRSEILDFGDQGFLLHGLLSETECQHFMHEGERVGFGKICGAQDNYRGQERLVFESHALANVLWSRMRAQLADIVVQGDPASLHIHGIRFLLQGTWTPVGLNSLFRLCRYKPGGHFAPHFDGYFTRSIQERSLQTLMVYLNGDFDGGSTNFVSEKQALFKDADGQYCAQEENVLCRIQPQAGLGIVFNHQRLHEGQKLRSGVKYILRTDVMYRNSSQGEITPTQERALQLIQQAEAMECDGDCMEAAKLYRQAFKLSPDIEALYGS